MSNTADSEYQVIYGRLCAARETLYSAERSIKFLAIKLIEECFLIIGNPIVGKVNVDISSPEENLIKIAMPNISLSVQLSGYIEGAHDKVIATLDDGSEFNALLLADVAFADDKLLTKRLDGLLNDILVSSRKFHHLYRKLEIWNRLTEISNPKLPEE